MKLGRNSTSLKSCKSEHLSCHMEGMLLSLSFPRAGSLQCQRKLAVPKIKIKDKEKRKMGVGVLTDGPGLTGHKSNRELKLHFSP